MRWAVHVAHMGRTVTYVVWVGKPEGKIYRVVNVRVLLNWFFKGYDMGVDWIDVAQV
jgi:hypothetical protein